MAKYLYQTKKTNIYSPSDVPWQKRPTSIRNQNCHNKNTNCLILHHDEHCMLYPRPSNITIGCVRHWEGTIWLTCDWCKDNSRMMMNVSTYPEQRSPPVDVEDADVRAVIQHPINELRVATIHRPMKRWRSSLVSHVVVSTAVSQLLHRLDLTRVRRQHQTKANALKLNLCQCPAIHTNYSLHNWTALQYNHNIWHSS